MTGIIDIGSNSARLLYNGKKTIIDCQLAQNLMNSGLLCLEAMLRTLDACIQLRGLALTEGATDVVCFATEAVRSAVNREEFIALMTSNGFSIDVLDSDTEGKIGFLGAYSGGTQGILDIGGASTELSVGDSKGIIYTRSLPIGCVRLKDYSTDINVLTSFIRSKIKEYGRAPRFDQLITIGGSASVLASAFLRLEPYDPTVIHNSILTYAQIREITYSILATPPDLRKNIVGLNPKKILVAPMGGLLLLEIMRYLDADSIKLSELDNLEGYKKLKNL